MLATPAPIAFFSPTYSMPRILGLFPILFLGVAACLTLSPECTFFPPPSSLFAVASGAPVPIVSPITLVQLLSCSFLPPPRTFIGLPSTSFLYPPILCFFLRFVFVVTRACTLSCRRPTSENVRFLYRFRVRSCCVKSTMLHLL